MRLPRLSLRTRLVCAALLVGLGQLQGQAAEPAPLVQNGLSPNHKDHLTAGGLGCLLGDGRLNCAP